MMAARLYTEKILVIITKVMPIQMIQAFERATGINIPYKIVDRRGGDVEAVYADTSLANKKLKWKTQFGIEEALKSAWDWEIAQAKRKQ